MFGTRNGAHFGVSMSVKHGGTFAVQKQKRLVIRTRAVLQRGQRQMRCADPLWDVGLAVIACGPLLDEPQYVARCEVGAKIGCL